MQSASSASSLMILCLCCGISTLPCSHISSLCHWKNLHFRLTWNTDNTLKNEKWKSINYCSNNLKQHTQINKNPLKKFTEIDIPSSLDNHRTFCQRCLQSTPQLGQVFDYNSTSLVLSSSRWNLLNSLLPLGFEDCLFWSWFWEMRISCVGSLRFWSWFWERRSKLEFWESRVFGIDLGDFGFLVLIWGLVRVTCE